jgi:dihydrofolate synthase/folylpolyglutamate synthase
VVTNVELDHVEYLGPTRADIAEEKAGIVKPGATLVLGETSPDLVPTFTSRGADRVVLRDLDFRVVSNGVAHGGRLLELSTPYATYPEVFLPLHGAHQGDNAAVALTAVECFLDRALGASIVGSAFAAAESPGRLEVVGHDPLIVIDGTKNIAGARAVRAALAEEFPHTRRTWVIGILQQKDALQMLEALGVARGDTVVCCRADIVRSRDPHEVADAARALGVDDAHVQVVDRIADAVDYAVETSEPDAQVVVAGSLYVAGPARAHLVH